MHEHRFQGGPARLRNPERLAWLEADHVAALSLAGKDIQSVLDVGTGTGIFAEVFSRAGLRAEGVDASDEMLEVARELLPGLTFLKGTAEALPYSDADFDLVFMGLLFHETDDRLGALQEAARVARQRVAILEWKYETQDIGPGLDERLSEMQVKELALQAGLTVVDVILQNKLVLYILDKAK